MKSKKIWLVLIALSLVAVFLSNNKSFASMHYAPRVGNPGDVNGEYKRLSAQAHDLNPKVLQMALKAYDCASKRGLTRKPLLTVVDYSKPSTEKRMWIFDLNHDRLRLEQEVAHGQGSGGNRPNYFSNQSGSHASSLGVFLTSNTYTGEHGFSMRLLGLEPGFNNHALSRAIVMHAADYVDPVTAKRYGRLGRSWGCFVVSKKNLKPTINSIKGGSLLFAYYPDRQWLNHSTFLQC